MDIFISYSRLNSEFVTRLYGTLRAEGFEIWVDWRNIPFTVDWWNEIKNGIEESDNFVFVVSQDAFTSPVCHLELAHAIEYNKRLVPIIHEVVDAEAGFGALAAKKLDAHTEEALNGRDIISVARQNWLAIARHNWLFFETAEQFAKSSKRLVEVIRTDFELARQHSLFLRRAITWDQDNARKPGYLLSRDELSEAEDWLAKLDEEKKLPKPTTLHREYILQSRKHLRRRRIRSLTVAAVTVMAGVISIVIALTAQSASKKDKIVPMGGDFNVLVADVALQTEAGMQASADGDWIASSIERQLRALKAEKLEENGDDLLKDVEIRHGDVGIVKGASRTEQSESAATLANVHGADVVIYGYIDPQTIPAQFHAEFYISPRLTGAEEVTGEEAFGSPIDLQLPLADDSANRISLQMTLRPRVQSFVQFIYGLGFVNAKLYTEALAYFESAKEVPEWHENEGKEILYLWMGSVYLELKNQLVQCDVDGEVQALTGFRCAQAYYDKALEINPLFGRAYIGLGNILLDQAVREVAGTVVTDCAMYEAAVDVYAKALLNTAEAEQSAHLELKVFYNSGLAYATAARNAACTNDAVVALAIQQLNRATEFYYPEDTPTIVTELGFRVYYQLGLTYSVDGQYAPAIEAFTEAIAIATPQTTREEDWQTLRWVAYNQRGYAHFSLGEAGDESHYNDALADYEALLMSYRNQRYSDSIVVADAALHAGLVCEALQQPEAAQAYYREVLTIPNAPERHVAFVKKQLEGLGVGSINHND